MSEQEKKDWLSRIHKGVTLAITEAVEEHRLLGRSISIWKDGKVIWLPAGEITPLAQRKLN